MKKARVIELQERARKAQREVLIAEGYSATPRLLGILQKRRRKASRRAVRALKRFLGRFVWTTVLDDRTRPEHYRRPK